MIISNTTPISNLLHADNISLLAKLFGTVYIPDAVANEVNVIFQVAQNGRSVLKKSRLLFSPFRTLFL